MGDGNVPREEGCGMGPSRSAELLSTSTHDHHVAHGVALFDGLYASVTSKE